MMRITEGRLTTLSSGAVSRGFSTFAKAAQELSTGVAVDKPSDDPAAWATAARARARVVVGEAQGGALAHARDRLESSDASLASVTDALSRARELALLFSNGPMNADGRAAGAIEIRALRDQMIADLNRRDADGQPLFSGDGAAAFDASGAYIGGGAARQIDAGEGALVDAGILGSDLSDALDAMQRLADALDANDTTEIQASIDRVTVGHAAAADARQLVGTQLNAIDAADATRTSFVDLLSQKHDRLIGIDPVDAATSFARAQQQVQASRDVASRIQETLSR